MTIKLRIILGFLLTTLTLAGSTIVYVVQSMRTTAEDAYVTASSQQLRLMNSYVTSFITTAERDAALMAKDPAVIGAAGIFPNFTRTTRESVYKQVDIPEDVRRVLQSFVRIDQESQDYVEVFAGFREGGFATSLDGSVISAGYNPTKRPWYEERAKSSKAGGIGSSYLSTSGEMVISATHKVSDSSGNLVGVVGLDVSLAGLSEHFREVNFGETGYFVLIENTGRILCDPKLAEMISKVIGKDVNDAGMVRVFNTRDGVIPVAIRGVDMRANILTNAYGWKIVALQADHEIFASTNSSIRSVCLISAIVTILVLVLAYFIVRSINTPLNRLVKTADTIARGDLSVSLDGKGFYGELAELQTSLSNMMGNLQKMIATAEEKSKEAGEQTRLAQEATREAEAARRAAENAKREGMLAAAGQLEEVVAIISSASMELSAQIEQSDNIATESAHRLSEAATAMNEMNAAVQEVAHNASTASGMSDETRNNAENGEKIVRQVLESIGQVHAVSLGLKEDMTQLVEHAQAINRIMGVISDIADQTNLLALNAAIEAARAGDAGRGFAVVADEVRKLAEKTMSSTQDVGNAIKAIQDSTAKSVGAVDNALHQVETATTFANQSGEALRQIVGSVGAAADQVNAIATASEEQSATSEEINQSIVHVNDMSGQTAQAMGEATKAVAELARQAQRLSGLISQMKEV